MERKLTKVVDGTEITVGGKMCSCGTDVANDLCSFSPVRALRSRAIVPCSLTSILFPPKKYLFDCIEEWNNLGDRKYELANIQVYNHIRKCLDDLEEYENG